MSKEPKEQKPKTSGSFWDHLEKITREAEEKKRQKAETDAAPSPESQSKPTRD